MNDKDICLPKIEENKYRWLITIKGNEFRVDKNLASTKDKAIQIAKRAYIRKS